MSSGRNASSGDGSAVFVNWVERELDDWEACGNAAPNTYPCAARARTPSSGEGLSQQTTTGPLTAPSSFR